MTYIVLTITLIVQVFRYVAFGELILFSSSILCSPSSSSLWQAKQSCSLHHLQNLHLANCRVQQLGNV